MMVKMQTKSLDLKAGCVVYEIKCNERRVRIWKLESDKQLAVQANDVFSLAKFKITSHIMGNYVRLGQIRTVILLLRLIHSVFLDSHCEIQTLQSWRACVHRC